MIGLGRIGDLWLEMKEIFGGLASCQLHIVVLTGCDSSRLLICSAQWVASAAAV
jgi:hypothetical protein